MTLRCCLLEEVRSICVNNFSSKITRPRNMLSFFKDTLSIEPEKLFQHADMFVHLFTRAITSEVPPPKV